MEAQQNYMIPALNYLVRITMGPNEETFKICVEFWQTFSARIFLEIQQRRQQGQQNPNAPPLMLDGAGDVGFAGSPFGNNSDQEKLKLYAPVLAGGEKSPDLEDGEASRGYNQRE